MKGGIDLHTHTNHSDGVLTPEKLLMLAKKNNLKAIAITDHDTVSGFKEYLSYKKDFGLEVVPGVEVGIKNEEERHLSEVHMLGYFIDYNDKRFLGALKKLNKAKREWLHNQVKVLNEGGLRLSMKEVKEVAGDAVPRRPHVWKIVEKHNVGKISREDFFRRTSFGGDLYVKRGFELSLEDCIRLIKNSGGVAVLAHPGFYDIDIVVKESVDAGVQGIEVNYRYDALGKTRSGEIVRHVNSLAEKYGLLKTGGSDFHDNIHGTGLGSVYVPYKFLEELKRLAGQ